MCQCNCRIDSEYNTLMSYNYFGKFRVCNNRLTLLERNLIIFIKHIQSIMQCHIHEHILHIKFLFLCLFIRNDETQISYDFSICSSSLKQLLYISDQVIWNLSINNSYFILSSFLKPPSVGDLLQYLPTPPLGQDMTQGQFLSGV